MAKSKNKKSTTKNSGRGSLKSLTPAQKAAKTKAANKAAKEAKIAHQKERKRISNSISYRNRKLERDVSIHKEDQVRRNKYLRELRSLYKEQNPKKNKSLTPREEQHQRNFRDAARMQLKMLTSISDKEIEQMSPKKRKKHVADVRYFKGVVDKITNKVFKDKEEPVDYTKIDFTPKEEGEDLDLEEDADLLESERMMLSYQAQLAADRLVKNPFFGLLIMQINDEEHSRLSLTEQSRLTAAIEFQEYTGFIRHHFCEGGTVRYDYEAYSNGVILFNGYCTKNNKRL